MQYSPGTQNFCHSFLSCDVYYDRESYSAHFPGIGDHALVRGSRKVADGILTPASSAPSTGELLFDEC